MHAGKSSHRKVRRAKTVFTPCRLRLSSYQSLPSCSPSQRLRPVQGSECRAERQGVDEGNELGYAWVLMDMMRGRQLRLLGDELGMLSLQNQIQLADTMAKWAHSLCNSGTFDSIGSLTLTNTAKCSIRGDWFYVTRPAFFWFFVLPTVHKHCLCCDFAHGATPA
jgi:hypothetical protein